MAELKTRILLRSDILSNWNSVNPVLAKGELAVVFDPTITGSRKIRAKIGDGVSHFTDLPYLADYDEQIAQIITQLGQKVDRTINGANGKALIFNESDGGGAKFENKDGTNSFVGVNDGGKDGIAAQLYATREVDGKRYGARLDINANAMYYTVGDKSVAQRLTAENEIAVKGDVNGLAVDLAQEVLDRAAADQALSDRIDAIQQFRFEIVDELPEASEEEYEKKIIYLVKEAEQGDDIYDEYICIRTGSVGSYEYSWEKIGDTRIDLSNYYTKAETDAKLDKKVDEVINGSNGRALIFNESDGGGAKFEHNDGTESFVGVNDGGASGIAAQMYVDKEVNGQWQGSTIYGRYDKFTYFNKDTRSHSRDADISDYEIAIRKDVDAKQDILSEGNGISIENNTVSIADNLIFNCGGAAAE